MMQTKCADMSSQCASVLKFASFWQMRDRNVKITIVDFYINPAYVMLMLWMMVVQMMIKLMYFRVISVHFLPIKCMSNRKLGHAILKRRFEQKYKFCHFSEIFIKLDRTFLVLSCTKIAQTVLLCSTRRSQELKIEKKPRTTPYQKV